MSRPMMMMKYDDEDGRCSNTQQQSPPRHQRADVIVRYVEFYAGIGGWTMSLHQAITATANNIVLDCCASLDHSHLCTSVYEYNHNNFHHHQRQQHAGEESHNARDDDDDDDTQDNKQPSATSSRQHHHNKEKQTTNKRKQKRSSSGAGRRGQEVQHNHKTEKTVMRIETLSVEQLDAWQADIWLMSPPCQPHTRQQKRTTVNCHNHQSNNETDDDGQEDARSQSFLHLCKLLPQLQKRPKIILLENVVGFESSSSCQLWKTSLQSCGGDYAYAEFHLQPTQVGIPNDRPRYYGVAVQQLRSTNNGDGDNGGVMATTTTTTRWIHEYFTNGDGDDSSNKIHTALPELGICPEDEVADDDLPTLATFLDHGQNHDSSLILPYDLLKKPASWCLDIVHDQSRRSSCFTSGYGKFLRGTGSVLLVVDDDDDDDAALAEKQQQRQALLSELALRAPEEREYDPRWKRILDENHCRLRYFSGMELARLFGFSNHFAFPPSATSRQQWKLMGNSINVQVAAKLVTFGLMAAGVIAMDETMRDT